MPIGCCRMASPRRWSTSCTYFYGAEAVRPPLLRTDKTKQRRRPGAKAEPAAAPAPAPAQGAASAQPNAAVRQAAGARVRERRQIHLRLLPSDHGDTDRQGRDRLRHPAGAGAGHLGAAGALLPRAACQPALRPLPRGGASRRSARTCCCRRSPIAASATWARRPPPQCRRPAPCATSTTRSRTPVRWCRRPGAVATAGRRRLPDRRDHGGSDGGGMMAWVDQPEEDSLPWT